MYFNYKKLKKELLERHAEERKVLLAAGIFSDEIASLFQLDMSGINSDRRFYRYLGMYIDPDNETLAYLLPVSAELDFMDGISSPKLHRAMMKLKPIEREIMGLHVVDGLSLRFIAELWGKSYDTTKSIYFRAIKKIKKFF